VLGIEDGKRPCKKAAFPFTIKTRLEKKEKQKALNGSQIT